MPDIGKLIGQARRVERLGGPCLVNREAIPIFSTQEALMAMVRDSASGEPGRGNHKKPLMVPLMLLRPNTALILGAAMSGGDVMALARQLADMHDPQPKDPHV